MKLRHLLGNIKYRMICSFTNIVVDGVYGGFWEYRKKLLPSPPSNSKTNVKHIIYNDYMCRYGAFVGLNTRFMSEPDLPHGLNGIHISDRAVIGRNVVILQQVTIGSNTLKGHPRYGSPTIGDNVFIGAGAKIIGAVTIGDNCRIGANCVVVKDMPANTTAVLGEVKYISHDSIRDNTFSGIND